MQQTEMQQNENQQNKSRQGQDPQADERATAPRQAAAVVQQARLKESLELFRGIGRLEASIDYVEQDLKKLPGGMPESVEKSWTELKANAQSIISKANASVSVPGANLGQIRSELKTLSTSLEVISGSINLRQESATAQIGLPTGSVIAYDPEDVAGIAALNGIIQLSQDPKKVDDFLKKLGVDKRLEGESVGQAIQRSMMDSIKKIKPAEQDSAFNRERNRAAQEREEKSPGSSPATQNKAEVDSKEVLPDSEGNYFKKRNR